MQNTAYLSVFTIFWDCCRPGLIPQIGFSMSFGFQGGLLYVRKGKSYKRSSVVMENSHPPQCNQVFLYTHKYIFAILSNFFLLFDRVITCAINLDKLKCFPVLSHVYNFFPFLQVK